MPERIKYALREIKRRKSRNLGIIAGYTVAVTFLVITVSFAGSSLLGTNKMLRYTGAQFVGFIKAGPAVDSAARFRDPDHEGLFILNNRTVLFPESITEVIRKSPNIRHVSPLLTFSMRTSGNTNRSWIVAGFDPADMETIRQVSCSATEVTDGEFLEPGDKGVVLLEQTFAVFSQYSVNDVIQLGTGNYRVKGILSPGTRPAKADIYMPLEEAGEVLNSLLEVPVKNAINVVLVDGASSLLNMKAMKDVEEILGSKSSTVGYGCFDPAGAALGITTKGMRLLGLVVFFSILVLLAALQYNSVTERSYEIGVLKAIGWSEQNIISQIFSESLLLSLAGGLAGCIIAVLLFAAFPVSGWLGLDESFVTSSDPEVLLLCFVLTLMGGVLSGSLAARISARLKPAEILRKL